jgi:parallel beta-helix repeat protein
MIRRNMKNKRTKILVTLILILIYINIQNLIIFPYNKNNSDFSIPNDEIHTNQQIVNQIFINDLDPEHNWSKTAIENDWCSGSGTFMDPYIIKDVIVDGEYSKQCIRILNSEVYFKIQNCTVTRGGDIPNNINGKGIGLHRVKNGNISKNLIQFNDGPGIVLDDCENLTINQNTINYNSIGIEIWGFCTNNSIRANFLDYNLYGIQISPYSTQNRIEDNNMTDCGIWLSPPGYPGLVLPNIIQNNFFNNKPIYYYFNQTNIQLDRLIVAQVILLNCSKVSLTNLKIENDNQNPGSIILYYCEDVNISDNSINQSMYYSDYMNTCNIFISDCVNITIAKNYLFDYDTCFRAERITNCTFTKNEVNRGRIYISDSLNNNFNRNFIHNSEITFYGSYYCNLTENAISSTSILLMESQHNLLAKNEINNTDIAIEISFSHFNNIIDNLIYDNNIGILLKDSDYCFMNKNDMRSNNFAISFDKSNENNLTYNTIKNTNQGIALKSSGNNKINRNNISNSIDFGIFFGVNCRNNEISENQMVECGLGIESLDLDVISISNNIPSSNLINGKPLYYYEYQTNLTPINFSNAGQILLLKCNNSLISNVQLSKCSIGLTLFFCSNITTVNNSFSYNGKYFGLYIFESHDNIFSQNVIERNQIGLYLVDSNYNQIFNNKFIYNQDAYKQVNCIGNSFYDNEIITLPSVDPILIIIITTSIIISSLCITISIIKLRKKKQRRLYIPVEKISKLIENEDYKVIQLRKKIVDLGTKFNKLNVSEIAEELNVELETIKILIKRMIESQELSAKLNEKSDFVEFNFTEISAKIDQLMLIYDDWEKKRKRKN